MNPRMYLGVVVAALSGLVCCYCSACESTAMGRRQPKAPKKCRIPNYKKGTANREIGTLNMRTLPWSFP